MNAQHTAPENKQILLKQFSTETLNEADQFDYWSQLVKNFADIDPLHPAKQGFRARAKAVDFKSFSLVAWKLDAILFRHTATHIGRSGLDHWILSFVRRGRILGEKNADVVQEHPGDLTVKSFASPFSGRMMTKDLVSVYLPRDGYPGISNALDSLENKPICGPLSSLLKDFISTIENSADGWTAKQADVLARSFSLLLHAAVDPTADRLAEADAAIRAGKFNVVRRFIQANLKSPKLNTEYICRSLKVSRRYLYYVLESHGGVARYIKSRRLEACLEALTDKSDQRLISTIAYEYGFTNSALFSRQFKQQYGITPRDAREGKQAVSAGSPGRTGAFTDWLLDMGTPLARQDRSGAAVCTDQNRQHDGIAV